jgi:hypothetical protein
MPINQITTRTAPAPDLVTLRGALLLCESTPLVPLSDQLSSRPNACDARDGLGK